MFFECVKKMFILDELYWYCVRFYVFIFNSNPETLVRQILIKNEKETFIKF